MLLCKKCNQEKILKINKKHAEKVATEPSFKLKILISAYLHSENFKKCWALENLKPLSAKQNILDRINKTRHNQ